MFSKNNQKMAQFRHADQRQRFAVRKLGIGVVSVLVGVALAGGVVVTDAAADTTETAVTAPSAASATGSAITVTTAAASDERSSAATPTAALTGVNKAAAPAQVTATSNDAGGQAAQPAPAATPTYQDFTPATSAVNATTTPTEVTDQNGSYLSVDKNTIGADGTKSGIDITFNVSARRNETYTITIPNSTIYTVKVDGDGNLPSGLGTTTVKTTAAGTVITYQFKGEASTQLHLRLAREQRGGLNVVGDYQRLIHWSVTPAGQATVENDPLVIWQMIHPSINPSQIGVIDPEPWRGITRWLPNTDYVYGFEIKQNTNGFNGWTWPGIDQDVNAGTTITIPVPTGFVLNEEWTQAKNNFTNGITITQPGGMGHDLIITVPARKGNAGSSFKFVGKVVVDRPATDELISASNNPLASNGGQAQVVETVLTPTGTTALTATLAPWTINLAGQQPPVAQGQPLVNAYGNNSANQFLLDHDDTNNPAIVNWFTFTNKTPIAFDGQSPLNLYLHLADGLHVTGVKAPVDPANLPGTTSYRYVITHPDQSQETGTVAAGEVIRDTTGKGIRDLHLIPNQLVPTAGTATGVNPNGDYGPTKQNNSVVALIAYGSLADTYDDGTPLKRGDQLVSSITAQSPDFNQGKFYTVQNTQTLINEADLRATYGVNGYQFPNTGQTPGTLDAGTLQVNLNKNASTTNQVFEPTLYVVLPKGTTLNQDQLADWGQAKVTTTRVNGQEIVKVDYTGTGQYFANGTLHLTNLNNALPGVSAWQVYMVSPATPLKNNPASLTAAERQALGLTTETVYSIGEGNWTIAVPATYYTPDTSQGNLDAGEVNVGRSDDKGSQQMQYYLSAFNYSSSALLNPRLLVNLPTATAEHFTFNLTGPVSFQPQVGSQDSLKSGFAGLINFLAQPGVGDAGVQIYYSTQRQTVPTEKGRQVSLAGYVPAEQVTDWAAIRSLVVVMPTIAAKSQLGPFVLTGEDRRVAWDAQKSGPLETVMTADGMLPFQGDGTTITIQGTATLTARYHYVDAAGTEHYIELPMLTKTYNDNVDTMKQTDFALTGETTIDKDTIDKATKLIPAGYELSLSPADTTIINGEKTWVTNAPNEKAAFDQVVKYYFDRDIVQYKLVHKIVTSPKTITKTVNYYYGTVGGTRVQDAFTTTVTITEKTDQVTGEKTYWLGDTQLPAAGTTTLAGQALPDQPGYTATVQAGKDADATGNTTVDYNSGDVTINVVYTANPQHAKFIYHDDTTGEDILTVTRDGVSDATIDYTTPAQIAAFAEQGYEKVSDDTNGQALTFDHDDDKDQVFTIHLKHKMEATTRTKELTRTIIYVDQNHQPMKGDDGQVLPPVVQKVTVTETGTKDLKTKTTTWHQDWTSGDHPAVPSPKVTGYTPNLAEAAKETVTSSDERFDQDQNTAVTVVYAPTQETVTTYYRTADGKDLKPSETQTGSYGNNYTTSAKEIEGYHLTTTPANANGIYTTNTPDVTYVYAPDEESVTVHYQTVDGTPLAKDDQIPGLFGDRYQTSAKEIKGYHLKVTPANANGIYTTNTPDVTYVYAPDTQTATLTFIDNTTPTHQPLAKLAVTGDYQAPIVFSDQGQSYQSLFDKYTKGDQAPYVLDLSVTSYKGQAVTYKLEGNDYFVYLVHHLVDDQRTKQITQTIHYVDQNGQPMLDEQGQTLPDSVQTVTVQQHGTKDLATGVTQWDGAWTSADYQAVDSPVVAGYTVDQAQVPKQTVTSTNDLVTKNQDTLITVTYTPVQRPARLEFIDLVTGETLTTVSVSGAYNSPINFTDGQGRGYKALLKYYTTGDQHYQLVVGDPAHVSYDGRAVKYTLDDDTYKVYLIHQTTVQDTKDVHQTIHYVDQAGQPMKGQTGNALTDDHQTVTLSRTGTHDLVTGKTTWNAWSTGSYQAVASPKVAGYTADQPTVAGETVNGDSTDKTVTVTYTPNQQTALVTYYDDNTGQPLGAVDQLSGKSDQTLTYTTAQRLKEYVDQGYELVRDETGGQPITLDHDDKVTQSYVVHLKHRTETVSRTKQITQTIQYVDRTGQPMKDAAGQTLADNVQTVTLTQRGTTDLVTQTTTWDGLWTTADYTTVASPVLTGYTPSQDQVTGTAVTTSNELVAKNQDTLVVITYAPNAATVKVHYQTMDGQPVADSQNLVGKYGEDYETTAKSVSGYHLIETPANATGKYTTNTPDVIYVYAPDEESVTVHYQTADGTPLADDEHATGVYGGEYTTSAKEISGYHLTATPSNATGKYTTDTPDVTYVYAPDQESVTVHYQTADGTPLADDEHATGVYGGEYTTSAKEIAGYHLTETPSNATGKYTTNTPDVTYVYAPDQENVTVHYQTAAGKDLVPSETQSGSYGSSYTTSAKEIPGYHLTETPGNATGKYTTNTPDVTYVYAPDEESVTVHYQTADGTQLADDEHATGVYGGEYTTSAKEIAGYHLTETPSNATGKYTTDTPDVTYVYAPDEESVTVHYQTADGTPLAPSETLHGEYGGTYTTKAKEIDGYRLVATPANASGTYTENTLAVIYVYVPAHKGETNEPTQPTAPVTPTSPSTPPTDQPAAATSTPAPADPHPTSGTQPVVSTPVARVSHSATAPASRLPQTGNDSAAAWQVALGGLLGSLSLLALVKRKRAQ